MPLVEVVSGANRRIRRSQRDGEFRRTLQAYRSGLALEGNKGEHPPGYLEHHRPLAEGVGLYRARSRGAILDDGLPMHGAPFSPAPLQALPIRYTLTVAQSMSTGEAHRLIKQARRFAT